MKLKIIQFNNIDKIILGLSIFLFFFGNIFYLLEEYVLLTIVLIFINFLFLIKFFTSPPLLFIFLFSFLHCLVFLDYFFFKFTISFWMDFQTDYFISKVLYSYFLFISILGNIISFKEINNSVKFDFRKYFKGDPIIFIILSFCALFILIFGIRGQNILEAGSYSGLAQNKSPIFEYFILIYFLMLIYSKNKFTYNSTLLLFFIFYVAKSLLFGGRIEVIQISLLVFLLLFDSKKHLSSLKIFISIALIFYLNFIFGIVRSNPLILFEGNIIDKFNPAKIIFHDSNNGLKSTTEGDVVQSSARMIGLLELNEISLNQRLNSFLIYLISPFLPSSLLPDYISLASYKQNSFKSGGGGLISTYFFIWLGYIGPILIAFFIGIVLNYFYIYRLKSKAIFIYGFCLLITFPRWHSYNPILLVKFSLYAILIFAILSLIKIIIKNVYNSNKNSIKNNF